MTNKEQERLKQAISLGLTGEQILGIMGMYGDEEPVKQEEMITVSGEGETPAVPEVVSEYPAMIAQLVKSQAELTAQIGQLQQELKAAAFRQPIAFAPSPEKSSADLAAEQIMNFLNPTTKEVINVGKN